jgi:hypothetical protein
VQEEEEEDYRTVQQQQQQIETVFFIVHLSTAVVTAICPRIPRSYAMNLP